MAEGWEDYYEMLGVDPEVSQEEIKHAYRELAKRLHPDKLLDRSEMARDWAEERLKKVNQAYQVLSDPQQRKQYDVQWSEQQKKEEARAIPPQPVVEPSIVRFQDVKLGQTQVDFFIIKNAGGPYTKIWFSNPDSWVRVTRFESINSDQELPLRVEIEAEGWDWDRTYRESIVVRLTNEETGVSNETQVTISLRTKPEPVQERYVGPIYTTRARPAYTPPPPPPTPKPKPRPKPKTKPKPEPKPRSKLKPVVVAGTITGLLIGLLWLSGALAPDGSCERNASGTKTCVIDVEKKMSKLERLMEDDEYTRAKCAWASLYPRLKSSDCLDYMLLLGEKEIEILATGGIDYYHYSSQHIKLVDESPPVLSANRSIVAFASNDGYIYLMSRGGRSSSGRHILKITKGYSPRWSPDGKKIIFTRR